MPEKLTPDTVLGRWERFLFYGIYGTGKTFTAMTAPGPIWVLGVGGANEFKSLYSKHFIKKHGVRDDVFFDTVFESRDRHGFVSDNPTGFDHVCDAIDRFLEWNEKEQVGIQTVVIDNATVLDEYMLNKAIAAEYLIADSKDRTVLTTERKYGIKKPHDSTWAGAQSLMERLVAWLKELPFHVILVAHERREYVQAEPRSRERRLDKVLPDFIGQQRISIPNAFDNVWRFSTSGGGDRGTIFQVQTVGSGQVSAKTRVGGILSEVERDVNITEVIRRFREHSTNITTK